MLSSLLAATQQERDALVALYNSTGGDNWAGNSNWNIGDPCDNDWHGVYCSWGNVISISLKDNLLTGSIPAEIGSLTNLTHLYLYNNQLTGSIPAEIGKLANLNYLVLYSNYLSREIPSSIIQTALVDDNGLRLEENCHLYSNDADVQNFIVSKMTYATYEEFLETQGPL